MKQRFDRHRLTWALSALFSVAVVVLVAIELDWSTVYDTFMHLQWGYLALAFAVYVINYALRTWRFRTLIYTQQPPFRQLMGVTSLHGMFLYLLPGKSGEISYPLLLNQRMRISLTESTATLLTARFFDFLAIALFLPVVLAVFWERFPPWMIYIALIFCGVVLAAGGGLVWLLRYRETSFTQSDAEQATGKGWRLRIARAWDKLVRALRLIDRRGQYWRLMLLTIATWLGVYANFYLIVLSMGYHLTYFEVIVVSIIMVPLTLLPIQGIANLGTHEVGWVAALALFGEPQEIALAIAVGSHVILLFFVLLLGGLGLLLQGGWNQGTYWLRPRGAND